jgi:PAS domain S-box-containing protein
VSIVLKDVSRHRHLQEELQRSKQELETVSEELQSANEELETTNEELQSTVEELETTNEELQSTNEELETMNEELQSTNEELHTLNDELRARSIDLNIANAVLGSVLTSMRGGLAVIDRSSQIVAWNRAAEDLWGLRSDEVRNRSFFSLDIGLPVDQLGAAIRASLAGEERTVTLQAVTRRGKSVVCEVLCTPLRAAEGEIQGTILMMELQETADIVRTTPGLFALVGRAEGIASLACTAGRAHSRHAKSPVSPSHAGPAAVVERALDGRSRRCDSSLMCADPGGDPHGDGAFADRPPGMEFPLLQRGARVRGRDRRSRPAEYQVQPSGEPLVPTPANAVGTFMASGIDLLEMERFVVRK